MDLSAAHARMAALPAAPLLAGAVRDRAVAEALRAGESALFPTPPADARMAACALAALHLWNDDWDACHDLCQAVPTPTGSYLHGIAHRREGHRGDGLAANLGNSRYWFRRSGAHAVFPAVLAAALETLAAAGAGCRWATESAALLRERGTWDPAAVSDWVAQAEAGVLSAQTRGLLEEMQQREMALLAGWCLDRALGR